MSMKTDTFLTVLEDMMKVRAMRSILGLLTLTAFAALPAGAQEEPYAQPDDSWISISGTVETVSLDHFTLDYGDGVITVEMDDADRDADAAVLAKGDHVTAYGRVDDDFMELATIEASSIYVEELGTTFYASAVDEEDAYTFVTVRPVVVGDAVLQGDVTSVGDDHFTLSTGLREITVKVEEMPYDPLDDEGYQQIEMGDRVSVGGHIDADLFEGFGIVAESIVELSG